MISSEPGTRSGLICVLPYKRSRKGNYRIWELGAGSWDDVDPFSSSRACDRHKETKGIIPTLKLQLVGLYYDTTMVQSLENSRSSGQEPSSQTDQSLHIEK